MISHFIQWVIIHYMIYLDIQVRVYLSCLCISVYFFIPRMKTWSISLLSGTRCSRLIYLFSAPVLDSAIFPGSPGSFWQIIFRSQVLSISFVHCHWDCCSRPFQQTELGIMRVCVHVQIYTHMYLYLYFFYLYVENYVFLSIHPIPFQHQRVHSKFFTSYFFN